MSLVDEDGWSVVPLKSRKGKSNSKANFRCSSTKNDEVEEVSNEIVEDIYKAICHRIKTLLEKNKNEVLQFLHSFFDMCSSWQRGQRDKLTFLDLDLVCFALGSFVNFQVSKDQLALLILMRQFMHHNLSMKSLKLTHYQLESWFDDYKYQDKMFPCKIFDPVFTVNDLEVLKRFNFQLVTQDEQGEHYCSKRTIFYMIHAPNFLYHSLYNCNWKSNQLENIFITGNIHPELEDLPEKANEMTISLKRQIHKRKVSVLTTLFNDTFFYYFK